MQSQPFAEDAIAESIDDGAYCNLDIRGTQLPIPENLAYFLSDGQLSALDNLENHGWRVFFIRRPLFEQPTVVVADSDLSRYAAIDVDGTLDFERPLLLRAHEQVMPAKICR